MQTWSSQSSHPWSWWSSCPSPPTTWGRRRVRQSTKSSPRSWRERWNFNKPLTVISTCKGGREPWSGGYGRRLMSRWLWVRIQAPYTGWIFFTFTIAMFVWKDENKWKSGRDGPLLNTWKGGFRQSVIRHRLGHLDNKKCFLQETNDHFTPRNLP